MKKLLLGVLALGVLALLLNRPRGTSKLLSMPEPMIQSMGSSSESNCHAVSQHPPGEETVGNPVNEVAALLRALEKASDPEQREPLLERAVGSMAERDLPRELQALENAPGEASKELRQRLLRRWSETNAPAAAEWVCQQNKLPLDRDALEQVALGWAATDPAAAAAWLSELPASEVQQAAALVLAAETAPRAPQEALELAGALPQSPERDSVLAQAAAQWAATDAAAATDWALKAADPQLQGHLLAAIAIEAAEQEPTQAANLVSRLLAPGEEQQRAAVCVAQRWAQSDPQAAHAWVGQFPDPTLRAAALQALVSLGEALPDPPSH